MWAVSLLPRTPDRYERMFVAAAWAALSVALFGYVQRYGPDVPWMDDWELVPVLTDARPATLRWLWIQQNEHRFPLTKLVFLAAAALTGGDFRAGMFASVALLSAVALAATGVARRLRGRASYADAVFPLLLLHPGHEHNVLGHIQLFFVTACALLVVITLVVAEGRWTRRPLPAALLALALLLLPLHSAAGALLAPLPALWAVYAGSRGRRAAETDARRAARLLLAGGAGALGLSALYFSGFVPRTNHPLSPSVSAAARATAQVMGMSLGPFGADVWPWATVAVALLCAATMALLVAALHAHPTERLRGLGLLLVMCAVVGIMAVTGVARGGFGPAAGFEARYALMAAPLLVVIQLAWVLYGGTLASMVTTSLLALLCLAFSVNVQHGLRYGRARRAQADALVADVRAGVPPDLVAARHYRHFYPFPDLMARRLRMLQAAGQGPYRGLPAPAAQTPCARWDEAPLRQIGYHSMTWRDGVGRAEGADPYVILGLGDTTRLCAVRLTLMHSAAGGGDAPLTVYWARSAAGWFDEQRQWTATISSSPEPQKVVVWINDEIDLLRVDPDERTEMFRMTSLELLDGR
jgi:hypothetical protein